MIDKIMDSYLDQELIKADGFDDAIIGIDCQSLRLIYSAKKCIEILMRHTDEEDARLFYQEEIAIAWFGNRTPIFCDDDF